MVVCFMSAKHIKIIMPFFLLLVIYFLTLFALFVFFITPNLNLQFENFTYFDFPNKVR